MAVVNLVRALARAGREREMLELAGIAEAIAAEQSMHGIDVTDAFDKRDPAVTEALARLGTEGEAILATGNALEPAVRVKRICMLLYVRAS